MTKEEAAKAIEELSEAFGYARYDGDLVVTLDGTFNATDLRRFAEILESIEL